MPQQENKIFFILIFRKKFASFYNKEKSNRNKKILKKKQKLFKNAIYFVKIRNRGARFFEKTFLL